MHDTSALKQRYHAPKLIMKLTDLDSAAATQDAAAIVSGLNNYIANVLKIIAREEPKSHNVNYVQAILGYYLTGKWDSKDYGRKLLYSLQDFYGFITGTVVIGKGQDHYIEMFISDLTLLLGASLNSPEGLLNKDSALPRVRFAIQAGQAKLNLLNKKGLTPDEIAILSGYSYQNIMRLIHIKKLPATKRGKGWLIRHRDAERFLENVGYIS